MYSTGDPCSEASNPTTALTRRDFGWAVASSAATVSLTSPALGDDPKTLVADKPKEESRQIPEPVYLLGAILRHYPDSRLDEVAINGILRDITGDLARGKVISNFPLKNSDEPSYVFQAWRGADSLVTQ